MPFHTKPCSPGHHSLVTPLDWKPTVPSKIANAAPLGGHHSLVTPLDWKQQKSLKLHYRKDPGHHSLVTPLDWKPGEDGAGKGQQFCFVTTRW